MSRREFPRYLFANIDLPKNDAVKKNNKKVMDGLIAVKKDKKRLRTFSAKSAIFSIIMANRRSQKKPLRTVKEEFAMKSSRP